MPTAPNYRIARIFADPGVQESLSAEYTTIERYDSFILLAVSRNALKKLSREYLTEDITEDYAITLNGTVLLSASDAVPDAAEKASATFTVSAPSGGAHHFLVQFIGPVKEQWLQAVEQAGGKLREPLNGFVYIVKATRRKAATIASLPFVRWVSHFAHADRISESAREIIGETSSAAEQSQAARRAQTDVFSIAFFGSREARSAAKKIADVGAEVLAVDGALLTVRVKGTKQKKASQLAALSALHGVRRIRERTIRRTSNNVAGTIMQSAQATDPASLGLSGDGEIIGVCDTGLDTGVASTIHADFQGRIAAIKSYPIIAAYDQYIKNPQADDGPADVDSGHGTHVAGSILGDGTASTSVPGSPVIRGLAPKARVVFQAVEQEMKWKQKADLDKYGRYLLSGLPDNLTPLFQFAYSKGARIHSNSWGGGTPGVYDNSCRLVDDFIWKNKDFCILFAAGNEGTDADGDGKVNLGSIASPGTAKNCITVGASENHRPGFNALTYGAWWPKDFPVPPVASDPMADNPNHVVAFSSRGPTSSQRTKPDIVAPGTFILSTRSTQLPASTQGWKSYPASSKYFYMGGTSMATPLVAGAVALLREYLRTRRGIAKPSAALLKAALLAGAVRLPGLAPPGTVLDNHQGFGRVSIDNIVAPQLPAKATFTEVAPGLVTGASWTQTIRVASAGSQLRLVLAYTDYPGSNLMNNLNLVVTDPSGKICTGNQRAGGPAVLDARNNVEVVQENSAAAGNWTIRVVASSVTVGPQDFALVVLGNLV